MLWDVCLLLAAVLWTVCFPPPRTPQIHPRKRVFKCRKNCSHSVKVSRSLKKHSRAAGRMRGGLPAGEARCRLETEQEQTASDKTTRARTQNNSHFLLGSDNKAASCTQEPLHAPSLPVDAQPRRSKHTCWTFAPPPITLTLCQDVLSESGIKTGHALALASDANII